MMKNRFSIPFSLLIITLIIGWVYFSLMPFDNSDKTVGLSEFSTGRARQHVAEIALEPHYIGSDAHKTVQSYLEKELRQLGLEVQTQKGFSLTEWGNMTYSTNIMARIKGTSNSKALLLLSHYDSAPHSYSKGAADDASGVAVILESVRAFLHNKTPHKNDIIILFTDAEELGLNGADLFVRNHPWAKEVGLSLNFEARGTSGPGYLLLEVNHGNQAMVDAFSEANPPYTVGNSLMYSIYKMMPNDTDLTVFRENNIQGFNFAFIDSHFNYHTAQDDLSHLSMQSLAHQGSYLDPLLKHFSNADLSQLNSTSDKVYFNTPIGFLSYGFGWNYILCGIAGFLLLTFVFIGFGKRILDLKLIGKGLLFYLIGLIVAGGFAFLLWKVVLLIYPQYKEILQGFTYNGHWYILSFLAFGLAISFLWYVRYKQENHFGNLIVGPLVIWLILNIALAVFLPGAGFFIFPLFGGLLALGHYVLTQKPSVILYSIFSIPTLVLIVPFMTMFPIGLGLKMLAGSVALLFLGFGLLLPVFLQYKHKAIYGTVFIIVGFICFIGAHIQSDFEAGKARPNSLIFLYNSDKDYSYWMTYDKKLDDWTQTYLGTQPKVATELNNLSLFSKYGTQFEYQNEAMNRDIAEPTVTFKVDSIIGKHRHIVIEIKPNRSVNRYDIFASESLYFHNFRANGIKHSHQKGSLYKRNGKKLLSYYVVENRPLVLSFQIAKDAVLDMDLMESSFDLLHHPEFTIKKRDANMMPKPFVLTDAVVIRKKIKKTEAPRTIQSVRTNFAPNTVQDTIQDADAGEIPEIPTQNLSNE